MPTTTNPMKRRTLKYRLILAAAVALVLPVTACCPARTVQGYQMIPASAFRLGAPDDDTYDFGHISSGGGFGWISSGTAPYDLRLYAPVILPHGATVTELTLYYYDHADTDISHLQLGLAYQSTGANFGMAGVTVTTTGRANVIASQSSSSVSNPQIDASANRVWLVLLMTVQAPDIDLRFYGARIAYTETR